MLFAQNFAMGDDSQVSGSYYAGWMFQWAFAAAAATIVSVRVLPLHLCLYALLPA
jgi:hypothetical protein